MWGKVMKGKVSTFRKQPCMLCWRVGTFPFEWVDFVKGVRLQNSGEENENSFPSVNFVYRCMQQIRNSYNQEFIYMICEYTFLGMQVKSFYS